MDSDRLEALTRKVRNLTDASDPVGVTAGDVRALVAAVQRVQRENQVLHEVLEGAGAVVEAELDKHLGPRMAALGVLLQSILNRTVPGDEVHHMARAALAAMQGAV